MKKLLFLSALCITFSGLVFADPYDSLSSKICKGAMKLKSKKIAIMSFPHHDGGYSSGSKAISERLTTRIAGEKDIQVIERSLLDKVINEMKLESTGMIDTETTKKIGKVLGVDAIVTGTLIDLKDEKTEVNARMINVETGEILSAAAAKVERTWKDKPVRGGMKGPREMGSAEQPGRPQGMPGPQGKPPEGEMESDETFAAIGTEETAEIQKMGAIPPYEMVERAQHLAQEKRYPAALAYAKQGFRLAQDRAVKAKALLTIGRIHEKLGNNKKSNITYRILIRKFPDLPEFSDKAKERLRTLR